MNETTYGYRRSYSGYTDYGHYNEPDTGSIEQQLRNIELDNREESTP